MDYDNFYYQNIDYQRVDFLIHLCRWAFVSSLFIGKVWVLSSRIIKNGLETKHVSLVYYIMGNFSFSFCIAHFPWIGRCLSPNLVGALEVV
jgi:hypothetical protein